jgi:hypothetical protein
MRAKSKRRIKGAVKDAVIAADAQGISAPELHAKTGISPWTIYSIARRLGIRLPSAWARRRLALSHQ